MGQLEVGEEKLGVVKKQLGELVESLAAELDADGSGRGRGVGGRIGPLTTAGKTGKLCWLQAAKQQRRRGGFGDAGSCKLVAGWGRRRLTWCCRAL